MMNLREIAAKKLTEELLSDCEEEYRQMYHNGSLRGPWPDFANDREQEDFYFYLGEEVSDMIRNLQDEIKETWGLTFKIYQFGNGATFAPDGFSEPCHQHFNRGLDTGKIVDFDYYEEYEDDHEAMDWWTEAYQMAKDHLAAFNLINDRVAAGAGTDLAEWWQETKEACELTYEEEEDQEDLEEAAA